MTVPSMGWVALVILNIGEGVAGRAQMPSLNGVGVGLLANKRSSGSNNSYNQNQTPSTQNSDLSMSTA